MLVPQSQLAAAAMHLQDLLAEYRKGGMIFNVVSDDNMTWIKGGSSGCHDVSVITNHIQGRIMAEAGTDVKCCSDVEAIAEGYPRLSLEALLHNDAKSHCPNNGSSIPPPPPCLR